MIPKLTLDRIESAWAKQIKPSPVMYNITSSNLYKHAHSSSLRRDEREVSRSRAGWCAGLGWAGLHCLTFQDGSLAEQQALTVQSLTTGFSILVEMEEEGKEEVLMVKARPCHGGMR